MSGLAVIAEPIAANPSLAMVLGVPSSPRPSDEAERELIRRLLNCLDANGLEHVGHALLAQAALRRQHISLDEAAAALDAVILDQGEPESPWLRARYAARGLVLQRWHPERVAEPLAVVTAHRVCERWLELNIPGTWKKALAMATEDVVAGVAAALDGDGALHER